MELADKQIASDIACSVCIANFNGVSVIDACLKSVLSQVCNFRYEIIVHDDASTDGSTDYIAARYPEVTLVRSESNQGYCVSNNRMAARAQGRYLLLLNNDASLYSDALSVLYRNAEQGSTPAILSLPQYDAESGLLLDRGCQLDPFFNPIPNLDREKSQVGMVIGACLWLPRTLWHQLGGFPEWFHMLAEDMYLCSKARLKGFRVEVCTESGYHHWVGHSLGGGKARAGRLILSPARRRLSERNKSFLVALFYPQWMLFLLLPMHALLLFAEGVALSLIRRRFSLLTQIYLYALASLWTARSRLCSERRALQAERRVGWAAFFSTFTFVPHKLRMLVRYGVPRLNS